eukprot:Hpha_TRINITY_DN19142_c0_g1::TRINITY_DN19142_c0_g1_i1::g.94791::m.94791
MATLTAEGSNGRRTHRTGFERGYVRNREGKFTPSLFYDVGSSSRVPTYRALPDRGPGLICGQFEAQTPPPQGRRSVQEPRNGRELNGLVCTGVGRHKTQVLTKNSGIRTGYDGAQQCPKESPIMLSPRFGVGVPHSGRYFRRPIGTQPSAEMPSTTVSGTRRRAVNTPGGCCDNGALPAPRPGGEYKPPRRQAITPGRPSSAGCLGQPGSLAQDTAEWRPARRGGVGMQTQSRIFG